MASLCRIRDAIVRLGRVAVGLLFASALHGQDLPCTPDCPGSPWSQVKYVAVAMGNGCFINVGYVERIACDGKIDFQFTGTYNWLSGACAQLQGIIDQDGLQAGQVLRTIHRRAMEALLSGHFATLPDRPPCGQSVDISYRVTYGSCSIRHMLYESEGVMVYMTEKCGMNCCVHLYTTCLDGAEVHITDSTPPGSNDGFCPYSNADPFTRCHQICYDD